VGRYYDFEKEVSVEIRSALDPYMVFAYTRDNLGADFTMFYYFSIILGVISVYGFITTMYFCCFKLTKVD